MERITHMTKTDLLARIREDRAAFAALWQGLSAEQMQQRPGPQADWSVKDLIAHVIWWENFMVKRVRRWAAGQTLEPITDEDRVNAYIFDALRDQPLARVLAEWQTNLPPIEKLIAELSAEDINDVGRFKTPEGMRLLDPIINNTFDHYAQHYADLEAYVQRVQG